MQLFFIGEFMKYWIIGLVALIGCSSAQKKDLKTTLQMVVKSAQSQAECEKGCTYLLDELERQYHTVSDDMKGIVLEVIKSTWNPKFLCAGSCKQIMDEVSRKVEEIK